MWQYDAGALGRPVHQLEQVGYTECFLTVDLSWVFITGSYSHCCRGISTTPSFKVSAPGEFTPPKPPWGLWPRYPFLGTSWIQIVLQHRSGWAGSERRRSSRRPVHSLLAGPAFPQLPSALPPLCACMCQHRHFRNGASAPFALWSRLISNRLTPKLCLTQMLGPVMSG